MAGKNGPRKLLIASVGVATINYVLSTTSCGPTVANLPAPVAGGPNAGEGGATVGQAGDTASSGSSGAGGTE